MFIDDSPALTVMELQTRARRMKKEHEVGLIVIDYLQLMRGGTGMGSGSRAREIPEISRSMKTLAKELNIPVIAISQLKRAPESPEKEDRRPRLADLESGAIEQHADVALLIYRANVHGKDRDDNNGLAEIIIGKQRNGLTGTVRLKFMEKYAVFHN